MLRRYKLLVGLGLVVLVGVLGIGIALAAGPTAGPTPTSGMMDHQAFVAKVAQKLGVSEQKLNEAMGSAHTEMLDEAVKAGQITQQQADQMKKHMEQTGSGAGMMGSNSGMMGSGATGSMMSSGTNHCGTSTGATPSGSSS